MSHWYALTEDNKVIPAEGNPPSAEYYRWLDAHKIIKQENVNGCWISTVFLGLDHSHTGDKEPVVFETMIFPSEDNLRERECWRYSTYEEAVEGHRHACEVAQSYGSGIDPQDLKKAASVIEELLESEQDHARMVSSKTTT